LDLLVDGEHRNTKSKTNFKYLEDYWIQPRFTKTIRGEVTNANRIPIRLYKFSVKNDWALFQRADDALFDTLEIATIDVSLLINPQRVFNHMDAIVVHCPVSLQSGIHTAKEFSVGYQIVSVHIQVQSTHHVKYEGRYLCGGSLGGGVYVHPSTSVLGIHLEAITEVDYEAEDAAPKTIANSDKRVTSEEAPYQTIVSQDPPKKKLKSDSESIASVAGGNNGLGSALIICKFPRLMHYISELEA
jgi:hypothetical protein